MNTLDAEPNRTSKEQRASAGQRKRNPKSVLRLDKVTFQGTSEGMLRLHEVDLHIRQGELVMIHLDRSQHTRELVSLLQGLTEPASGRIQFEGMPWSGYEHEVHFQMRSRMGRVFESNAWVNNLNVTENVLLASEHHGETEESIQREVNRWCEILQIPRITRERPGFIEASRLQKYQWLRAFLFSPSLLILERPMRSLDSDMIEGLVRGVNELLDGMSAVLWFAATHSESIQTFRGNVSHYRLRRGKLFPYPVASTSSRQKSAELATKTSETADVEETIQSKRPESES